MSNQEGEPPSIGPRPETPGHLRKQEPLGQGVEPKQRSVPGDADDPGLLPGPGGSQGESGRLDPTDVGPPCGGGINRPARPVPREEKHAGGLGPRPENQGPLRAQEPLGPGVEPEQLPPPPVRPIPAALGTKAPY